MIIVRLNLKGNSLEISDDSDFIATKDIKKQTDENEKLMDWWKKLPNFKKNSIRN